MSGRCSIRRSCRIFRIFTARNLRRHTLKAEEEGNFRSPDQGPRPVRQNDADDGPDRQRLDDIQGRQQPQIEPDRDGRRTSFIFRIYAPRSSRSRRENETAVCNLGSIQVARVCEADGDGSILKSCDRNVRLAVRQLDRVIDLNYYAIPCTSDSNSRWRNIGLGVMGLQDVFFRLRLAF